MLLLLPLLQLLQMLPACLPHWVDWLKGVRVAENQFALSAELCLSHTQIHRCRYTNIQIQIQIQHLHCNKYTNVMRSYRCHCAANDECSATTKMTRSQERKKKTTAWKLWQAINGRDVVDTL